MQPHGFVPSHKPLFMDRNTLVGFGLIALLLIAWSYFSAPSQEEIEAQQRMRDSLEQVQVQADSLAQLPQKPDTAASAAALPALDSSLTPEQRDSVLRAQSAQMDQEAFRIYGPLAPASKGEEKTVQLENDELRITFSSKGGKIVDVWVKNYLSNKRNEEGKFVKDSLHLLNNSRNRFAYQLPVKGISGQVSTEDLYFEPKLEGNVLRMRAQIDEQRYIEQRYELGEGFTLDYDLQFVGLDQVLRGNNSDIVLNWDNYLNKLEKNASYEQSMTTVYFKEDDSSPDYCSCTSDDEEVVDEEPVKWVGHVQQFFNTTLIAENKPFAKAFLKTEMTDLEQPFLKYLSSEIRLPYDGSGNAAYDMRWFLGPNDYEQLAAQNIELEEIIPFGWSIFGAINRYVFRPLFNFLAGFIPSYGVIILLLTLLVRLALYPLQYRMLLSGIKTSVLRPEIKALKEKYKDDQQRFSQEQMKLYQQTGVNPLGGCLPMLLQMPIWFALYRFFPASIDFRQEGFLWADDLSTYDSILDLGFNIPLYGDHVSLFTLLWVISMLAYLIYNSRTMDMTAVSNPTMKYVQYLFPFIFFFVLNSWAAGLTAYMFFSNIFNIAQTVITKQFIISEDKVRAGIEEKRKNPTKSKFQKRLDKMMQQQEEIKKRKKK